MLLKEILRLSSDGTEVSKLCIERLRQLRAKEIDMVEFEKELAYISIEYGFEDYHYKSFPSIPFIYQRFLNLAPEKREKLKETILQDREVKQYLKEYAKVLAHNNMIFWWLTYLLSIFEREKDQERYNLVRERLKIEEVGR